MTITTASVFAVCDEYGVPRTTPFPSGFVGKPNFPASGSLLACVGVSNTKFNPDGGNPSDDQITPANPSVTLNCTTPATWTYTGGSGGTASQPSGYVGTSITFTRGTIGTTVYSVHGSSNGIERDFTVTLTKESNA